MATITELLSQLQTDKNNLVANLISKGVEASETETFTSLVPKVLAISTGIDTSDATATAADMKNGVTAYVNGEKITGSAYTRGNVNAVVDGKPHYLQTGFYEGINIPGDTELLPENIKSGIEIYGTTGTLESLDTSDATATSSDILLNKTAYVNREKLTGTIESLEATEYIPSNMDQIIEVGKYISGNQTIKGDANLLPQNIKNGVSIFGVEGTYDAGGTTEESFLIDCANFNSSTEVYNAYSAITMVSQDGSYQSFSNLEDGSVYNRICAYYGSGIAGINLRSEKANSGFYLTIPINFTKSYALLKTVHFVSNWITLVVNIKLIQADSVDEIQNKIVNSNFVYEKSITLTSSTNNQTAFFECTGLPVGEYYIFIEIPSAVGGNDATLNRLSFLFI